MLEKRRRRDRKKDGKLASYKPSFPYGQVRKFFLDREESEGYRTKHVRSD